MRNLRKFWPIFLMILILAGARSYGAVVESRSQALDSVQPPTPPAMLQNTGINQQAYPAPMPYYLPNQSLTMVLVQAAKGAGKWAETIGKNVEIYVEQKQFQKAQTELLQYFHESFDYHARIYPLSDEQRIELRQRVEEIYIREGLEPKYGLDMVNLRDMPLVIRKVQADIQKETAWTETVETYSVTGVREGVWPYKEGKLHGNVLIYNQDGELRYIDTYQNGNKASRKKFDDEGRLEFEQDYPLPGDTSAVAAVAVPKPAETANNSTAAVPLN